MPRPKGLRKWSAHRPRGQLVLRLCWRHGRRHTRALAQCAARYTLSATRTASTMGCTSCTRTMSTPVLAHTTAAAAVATMRSSGRSRPVNVPRKCLREGPIRVTRFFSSVCWCRRRMPRPSSCTFWSPLLAKPSPRSATRFHLHTPASCAATTRCASSSTTSSTTLLYVQCCAMVSGMPRMCMTMMGTWALAAKANMSGSAVPPDTSLSMCAPASRAAAATRARNVSMLRMGDAADVCVARAANAARTARMTGTVRCSSSSSLTGVDPGRVEHPPMSMMSAPASANCSACATAALSSVYLPPSLKLSGVTLMMPMMYVRLPISRTRSFCGSTDRTRL
mmetsp:Transcript_45751/g.115157  ORF Transcript_45751/g.115157 Transcript_45751/m.115157 type:complete len:337 (-) Transcript_45751:952-1962(-)